MDISFVDLAAQQNRIRPQIDQAIARVLAHGKYIMGPEVKQLETELADYCGVEHAISVSSGTDALLIALMALDVGPGDAVLCPNFTYTATPESIALLKAKPLFVDVDPDTFNLDPDEIKKGVLLAKSMGLKPKGIITVDLFGLPANYGAIEPIAKEQEMFLLCDAAQSFGAATGKGRTGQAGDITATSFFPAKPLGCYGDGGAVFSSNDALAEKMKSIRLHGKASRGGKYDIERIGLNGRLDTIQAAILLEKLAIFESELEKRQSIAERYCRELSPGLITPRMPSEGRCAWAQYTVRSTTVSRSAVLDSLNSQSVPAAIYYPRPLHEQNAYSHFPRTSSEMAASKLLSESVFSIPIHPYLTPEQQDRVIEVLNRAVNLNR